MKAPSELVMIGDTLCIDTKNASRLVPVIDELKELGFLDYAARQKRLAALLFMVKAPHVDRIPSRSA